MSDKTIFHIYQPGIPSEGRNSVSGTITINLNVEISSNDIEAMKHYFSEMFDIPSHYIKTHEEHAASMKRENIYYCSACHTNTVDADNGFDTCQECLKFI